MSDAAIWDSPELLPTLPGFVHGVVGRDPWRLQCDGCGAIETPDALILMDTKFAPRRNRDTDKRRLCGSCQTRAGWIYD